MRVAFPVQIPPADLAESYVRDGLWDGATLGGLLATSLGSSAQLPFVVHSEARPFAGTIADVAEIGRRFAAGLRARGIGRGDVVAYQLPNWMEAAAVFWGLSLLGAVIEPVVASYGSKEVEFILRESGARAFITARRVRERDYVDEIDAFRGRLTALELIGVVGGDAPSWAVRFSDLLAPVPLDAMTVRDPADVAVIGWTSGTSAQPKGVLLSERALAAEVRFHMASVQHNEWPLLQVSPLSHVTGMLTSVLLPPYCREAVHVADAWTPARILALLLEYDLSTGSGAPLFVEGLINHPDFLPAHLAQIPHVALGGAPVPKRLAHRLEAMGISVRRGYGCTEHPSIAAGNFDDPIAQRAYIEGPPLAGVEVQIVDDSGLRLGQGKPGEIITRGPDMFSGYTDPKLTAAAIGSDGWFSTGDVGMLDADGWLHITDRIKDIIIRGGENISAAEVEEALTSLPTIAQVAVVAAPDARLGEHACAFVVPAQGATPTLRDLRDELRRQGMARWKWPEELHVLDQPLPRTASGKIQKNVLRERARGLAG